MAEPQKLTSNQVIEMLGAAVACSTTAVIMALHRQAGVDIDAVITDLRNHQPAHNDQQVEIIARQLTIAIERGLLLAKDEPGRA